MFTICLQKKKKKSIFSLNVSQQEKRGYTFTVTEKHKTLFKESNIYTIAYAGITVPLCKIIKFDCRFLKQGLIIILK